MGTVKLKDFRPAVMALQTNALAKLRDISQGKLHSTYWGAISEQLMESGRLLRVIDANPDAAIAALSAQQPADCVGCEGNPAPENIPCAVCGQQPASDGGFTAADMMDARQEGRKEAQQLAAVDGLNVWRSAFIAERSARYREDGMGIEQAHIHAETDASRIAARAALQGESNAP